MNQIKNVVFWITGSLIVVVLISSYVFAYTSINVLPKIPLVKEESSLAMYELKQKEIANYKELSQVVLVQRAGIYDAVIGKVVKDILSAILTAVLSFIFLKAGLDFYRMYKK